MWGLGSTVSFVLMIQKVRQVQFPSQLRCHVSYSKGETETFSHTWLTFLHLFSLVVCLSGLLLLH